MSNIADGIAYALEQSRLSRVQEKTAEIPTSEVAAVGAPPSPMGSRIKQAAQVFLADDDEDVTVGDLQALMQEFR
jgi:hypothetical protein